MENALLEITVKYKGVSRSIALHCYNVNLCPKPVLVHGASSQAGQGTWCRCKWHISTGAKLRYNVSLTGDQNISVTIKPRFLLSEGTALSRLGAINTMLLHCHSQSPREDVGGFFFFLSLNCNPSGVNEDLYRLKDDSWCLPSCSQTEKVISYIMEQGSCSSSGE